MRSRVGATYVVGLTLAVALVSGCGGGSDDASATTVRTPLTCTSDAGLTFTTELDSCDEAFARGGRIAAELGLATEALAPAAAQAVANTCHQIQGTEIVTYDVPEIAILAEKLNSSGVCRGAVANIVPPTTVGDVNALEGSAGWTLVAVVDGDTLDITSAVEGQRRIDMIGI